MLKKFMSLALAGLLAVGASLPAAAPAEARNRGAKVAAGIALGVAAAAIIANSRRAHAEERYYEGPPPRRYSEPNACQRWSWKCDHGNDWACEKFDRNC